MRTVKQVLPVSTGIEWLVSETDPHLIFIPEDFSEEQKMIRDMCRNFMNQNIIPHLDHKLTVRPGLMRSLIKSTAEQGLLFAGLPEEYGGAGKDFVTTTIIMEELGVEGSYTVSCGVHASLGTMPIVFFGTEEQKEKYLPNLVSVNRVGAYALTEPNSGSDALGAKTTAVLSDDGKYYLLNGQKCWISNGGFADVFTVFAKVDGNKFTGFIVEKNFEGFTRGEEEHKIGLKGSSTVQLFFQDCKVPVENVLGEIGRGHVIAFNILNGGRYRLGAIGVGAGKSNITRSLQYAITREQFKNSIANFGAIKHKLAEMAIRIWVAESSLYRTGKLIEDKEMELMDEGNSYGNALLLALEEFSVECAILKVTGSEALNYVVDEGVQIHGGNGFSEEYQISKAYCDSRINRIFEGTNEINRLLIMNMLLKKAANGKMLLFKTSSLIVEKKNFYSIQENGNLFRREKRYVSNFKRAIITLINLVVEKYKNTLESEQEILMSLSDMIIETYNAESALLRVIKMAKTGYEYMLQADIMRTYFYEAAHRINKAGKDVLNALEGNDELLPLFNESTKVRSFNAKEARRRIADRMIEERKYCF
jgi:alkylation response protein AidB-like acyl-CoA dehydrogenase